MKRNKRGFHQRRDCKSWRQISRECSKKHAVFSDELPWVVRELPLIDVVYENLGLPLLTQEEKDALIEELISLEEGRL